MVKPKRKAPTPTGRPKGAKNKLTPYMAAVQRLTAAQVAELGSLLITHDVTELEKVAKDRSYYTVLQVWFAKIAVRAMREGDSMALDRLLDRVVGRSKEYIELSGPDGGPIQLTASPAKTQEEMVAEIEQLRQLRLRAGND
jgi:hypothetical protein